MIRARRVGLLVTMGVAASCAPGGRSPPSDPELRAELGIPAGVAIHRIDLSDSGDGTRILPRSTEIRSGDVVQFVMLDHRVHLVRFEGGGLEGNARDFLRETGQETPPPLVEQGARLVLTFEGAPVGSYPFIVDGNGLPVQGEIRVRPLKP